MAINIQPSAPSPTAGNAVPPSQIPTAGAQPVVDILTAKVNSLEKRLKIIGLEKTIETEQKKYDKLDESYFKEYRNYIKAIKSPAFQGGTGSFRVKTKENLEAKLATSKKGVDQTKAILEAAQLELKKLT